MPMNTTRARQLLRNFDFRPLFIEELGWDRYNFRTGDYGPRVIVTLSAVAQKRGMVAYRCRAVAARSPRLRRIAGRSSTKLPRPRTST